MWPLAKRSESPRQPFSSIHPVLSGVLIALLLGVPSLGITTFYCIFHRGFGVPFEALINPFIVVSAVTIIFGPLVIWSRNRLVQSDDARALYATSSLYGVIGSWLYLYYAADFGIVSNELATTLSLIIAFSVPLSMYLGYRGYRKSISPAATKPKKNHE